VKSDTKAMQNRCEELLRHERVAVDDAKGFRRGLFCVFVPLKNLLSELALSM
jgi:hypothetical protein